MLKSYPMDFVIAKVIVDTLKLAYDMLKSASGLKRHQTQSIKEEAELIVRLASIKEIDRYIADPRRKFIDDAVAACFKATAKKRATAKKKAAPRKMATKTKSKVSKQTRASA